MLAKVPLGAASLCAGRRTRGQRATMLRKVAATQNRLIAQLPTRDRSELLAACELVPLVLGAMLWRPGAVARHLYFPDDGFISIVMTIEGTHGLEVGMVGREGALGAQLALG